MNKQPTKLRSFLKFFIMFLVLCPISLIVLSIGLAINKFSEKNISDIKIPDITISANADFDTTNRLSLNIGKKKNTAESGE